jgi:hypothetical protein
LLAALPLVLVTGVALAAQPGGRRPSSAVIHACVKKKTGLVRIVAASAACRPGESAMAWNAQGARGPSGAPGTPGPQGPAGPQEQRAPRATPARKVPPARPDLPARKARRDPPAPRCPRSRA